MAKAVEAFRNIGEVSIELGVKKHVLRFWEAKFPQLKPMKRGGGRRLYRPGDVELLRGLHDLLQNKGYTIRGVQKILREDGVEAVKAVIKAHAPDASSDQPCAIEPEASPAKTRQAASPKSLTLSASQVGALHAIVAELESCRSILGGGGEGGPAKAQRRRAPLRA